MVFLIWIPNGFKSPDYSNGLILQFFLMEVLIRLKLSLITLHSHCTHTAHCTTQKAALLRRCMKGLFPSLIEMVKNHEGYNINEWTKTKQNQLNQREKKYISYQVMNKIKLDQKHNLEQSVMKQQKMHNSGKSAINIFWSTECTKAQV